MLDLNLIREQPDLIRTSLKNRQLDASPVDDILRLDEKRRLLLTEVEQLKAERNTVSKEIGKMKDAAEREKKIAAMREVGERISALDKERNRRVKQSERELASQVRGVQDRYKLLAVLLPPILPILLAFFVYFHRRKAEQEGVDTRRLRYGKVPEEAAA